MKRVDSLLADYGAHHRAPGNLVCHAFGVTLIVYGIVAVLGTIPLGPVNVAEALIAAAVAYYATLDLALAAAMLGIFAMLDVLARAVGDWRVGATAFVLGWILQAVGHSLFEKNRPAFFKNLLHLMVGPLFLVNELLRFRRVAPAPR
jgi:uncharacterized membrane protein YGL010W